MTTQRRQRPGIGRHAWAFAFAGCASMSAHGQERRVDFEEIIVTAQKVDQRIQDVPISIKAIDDKTLETINADGLEDLTRLVPSLTMTNMTGHPQMGVPCGFINGNDPVSLTFIGRLFEEGAPARVAKAFQDVTEWHRMQPPKFKVG